MSAEEIENWDFVQKIGFSEVEGELMDFLDYGEMCKNLPIETERTFCYAGEETEIEKLPVSITVEKTWSYRQEISPELLERKGGTTNEWLDPLCINEDVIKTREGMKKSTARKVCVGIIRNHIKEKPTDTIYGGFHFSFFIHENGMLACRCDVPIVKIEKCSS